MFFCSDQGRAVSLGLWLRGARGCGAGASHLACTMRSRVVCRSKFPHASRQCREKDHIDACVYSAVRQHVARAPCSHCYDRVESEMVCGSSALNCTGSHAPYAMSKHHARIRQLLQIDAGTQPNSHYVAEDLQTGRADARYMCRSDMRGTPGTARNFPVPRTSNKHCCARGCVYRGLCCHRQRRKV